MYGERSISWLPRVCGHDLLEPVTTWQEKWMNVHTCILYVLSLYHVRFASLNFHCTQLKQALRELVRDGNSTVMSHS